MHLKEDGYQVTFVTDPVEAKRLVDEKQPIIGFEFPENDGPLPVEYIISNPGELWFEDIEEYYLRAQDKPLFIMETDRCYIRELSMDDLDDLFELYQAPGVTDYMEGLFEYEEEKAYQRNYIDLIYKLYGFGMWLVFEKSTNRLIGRAGLEVRENCREENQAELGYLIHPKYWRKGYATEVCSAIMKYAVDKLELKSLLARCDAKNAGSVATLRKLGFEIVDHLSDGDDLWKKEL